MPNPGAFLSYVFVVTFTPGPNNILSMVNAGKDGYRRTLRFLLGIFTGFAILMILCGFFNRFLFDITPQITRFMGFLGAAYMLYLAYKIVKPHQKGGEDDESASHPLNSFQTGMTMQFVNPKVILYGITVISNFVTPYYQSYASLIFFAFFFAAVAFVATSCWALFGSLMNTFLMRYERPFNLAMALLLVYSAVSISGITHLIH
jgi:threonine/homoserine/homoserine lactone efflux protein